MESTFMDDRVKYQYTFFKVIETSNLSFFNLTSIRTDYNFGRISESYLIDNFLFYEIKRGVSLATEIAWNQQGLIVAFGARYSYNKNNFRFDIFPSYKISDRKYLFTRMLLEYQTPLVGQVALYFRGQINYSTDFSSIGNLSNLYRLGLQYKNIRFGIGTPWFKALSTASLKKELVGIFVGVSI
ncbi:hypothetical protein [Flagellimonas flava]|uniref:hypothetical protein n=1 Tax=Flagellimonas flava TaxID=570519 RepID=UPI001041BEB4|nr:hypothetical protein [Allomuricauda flava]